MKTTKYLECGCCGYYHKEGYGGDCRNDNKRYNYEDLDSIAAIEDIEIVDLDQQLDSDGAGDP